jgi:hypothetical protein
MSPALLTRALFLPVGDVDVLSNILPLGCIVTNLLLNPSKPPINKQDPSLYNIILNILNETRHIILLRQHTNSIDTICVTSILQTDQSNLRMKGIHNIAHI